MPTIEYLHVCDYAFPAEGGKPCVIGIFDSINCTAFPVAHPHMAIAMRLRGSAHEVLPLKIELSRPNGEVLATLQNSFALGSDGSGFINMNMINTTFPEAGRYTVKVSSGGQTLISHSLLLQKAQPPIQSAPPGLPPKKMN